MAEARPISSLFLICAFFAAASSTTMAVTTPMLVTTTESYKCNWTRTGTREQNNQSCYLFISDPMTVYEANKSCEDEGAHLVSISNEGENAVVLNMIKTNVWIGLYRLTNDNCAGSTCANWMWLDGSDFVYFNWGMFHENPGQCVTMNADGRWQHGRFCSDKQGFVCKKNIPLTTSTSEPTTMIITSPMADTSASNSASHDVPDKKTTNDRTGNVDNRPIIIGCVVGGLALVVIVTVVAVVLLKRHRTSRPIDQPVEVKDEEIPAVDKHVRYNRAYEDVETHVTFKPSPGNTDTGAPGNTDTGAHGMGDNPHHIYSEAIKKQDRPGSEGILVKENTLYGYGK